MTERDLAQSVAVESLCATLAQGDLLTGIQPFSLVVNLQNTQLAIPQAIRDDAEGEIISAPARRRENDLVWSVITQTCDLRRPLGLEPYIFLSPVSDLTRERWQNARDGIATPRHFSYPEHSGGLRHPVLDIRIMQTVEKAALVADEVRQVYSPDRGLRERLAGWLGRRFARAAFPEELENLLLRPLREQLRRRLREPGTPAGALLACRERIMISYSAAGADVLFIVRGDRVLANPVFMENPEAKLQEGARTVMRPLARRLDSSGSGYSLTWDVVTPNNVRYSEILYRYQPFDVGFP